ncbi:MAG: GTPase ObgE [Endomicrobium sp.]|jgi:GTP-binding protein|nr:GTPase ObgE [Endomicrobium sp.]
MIDTYKKFIDKITIYLVAGCGGNGCTSFRREKYVPRGSPDGGNGGKGGDVFLECDDRKTTLLDLSYTPKLIAENGRNGSSNNKSGRAGSDLIIKVPPGTLVFKNNKFYADLNVANDRILIVKGGRGGRGNSSFKTSRNVVPKISENGEPGETAKVFLELILIANVGFVGLPNSGKSTLLSKISSAKPKIANYPFTTLTPNLGAVSFGNKNFIAADIPGIIEGAHNGVGLGLEFLRHIKRTSIIVYVIDVSITSCGSDVDPRSAYDILENELSKYSKRVIKKHTIIALNKVDLQYCENKVKKFKEYVIGKNKKIFEISAITGHGINELITEIVRSLKILEKPFNFEFNGNLNKNCVCVKKYIYQPEFQINFKNGVFVVTSAKLEKLTMMTKFNEYESLSRYQNIIKKIGLESELEKNGAKSGDIVRICDFEFVFKKDIED